MTRDFPPTRNGRMAPPERGRFGSITRPGSNVILRPRPWQEGHAPRGLLKEKSDGPSSAYDLPQRRQSIRSVKSRSSPVPSQATIALPSPVRRASSIESVIRFLADGLTAIRSTTTSTVCGARGSRRASFPSSPLSPST